MHSLALLTILSVATATPLQLIPRTVCDARPTGPTTGAPAPRSQPAAANAYACQQLCIADPGCLSFVFGLPASATTPKCMLFGVAAAQVPPQADANLVVFDKGCTGVPTAAPVRNADNGQAQTGNGNEAATPNGGNAKTPRAANVCDAAPSGPTTGDRTPLKVDTTIATKEDCLKEGKATQGCKSVMFGKPSPQAPVECRLFDVEAAQLPKLTGEESFVAFDVGC